MCPRYDGPLLILDYRVFLCAWPSSKVCLCLPQRAQTVPSNSSKGSHFGVSRFYEQLQDTYPCSVWGPGPQAQHLFTTWTASSVFRRILRHPMRKATPCIQAWPPTLGPSYGFSHTSCSHEVNLRGLSQASLQSEMSSQPREACRALGSRGRQTGHLHTRVHTDTRTASSSPGNPCVRKHGCPRPVLVLRNLFTPHRALSSLSPGTAYRS